MIKSRWLGIVMFMVSVLTLFACAAQARLVVGSPDKVISDSTLILTGRVTTSYEAGEERIFAVSVDRVLKGEYVESEIVLTGKKNQVYGWVGTVHALPETDAELLLFLRNDDNGNPCVTFDLNCIAVIEGQRVTGLLGGSNVTLGISGEDDKERWDIPDYIETYSEFLSTAGPMSRETEEAVYGKSDTDEDLWSGSVAATSSVFWPGVISLLLILGASAIGLWHYARSRKNRSPLFWIAGIVVCIVLSYIIAAFASSVIASLIK